MCEKMHRKRTNDRSGRRDIKLNELGKLGIRQTWPDIQHMNSLETVTAKFQQRFSNHVTALIYIGHAETHTNV